MEPGRISVFIGLGAALASVFLYLLSLRGNRRVLVAARVAYAFTAISVFFCFGRLMWLVAHKQFQYHYVFQFVSPDLESPFLYAATWAGQEGSFLLWAFWTAVIGGILIWKAGKWESRVMPVFVSTLAFLFAILVWLSPYTLLTRADVPNYPGDLPWPPQFGMGLNPSLQNYWMAIHPPTIFFGFSSLAVPFSYAIAAMIWRDYEAWAPRVMPFVLMTTATLGVGLMMGGYWAYETQGWHGFWGWDPVENASLFPWLGGLGLLHGLVVQKNRGGMGRTNLFLAILSWMLFLYGTFLTRSGVLAKVSVHSFDMLGRSALSLLLVLIALHGIGGLGLLIWRWRTVPRRPISDKALSRDTVMVLAVTLIMVACAFVLLGTSFPLLATWIHALKGIRGLPIDPKSDGMALLPMFYNQIGSVVLIPTLLLMGAVPFLAWGKTDGEKFLWKVIKPWFAAIGIGALVLWFAFRQTGQTNSAGEPFPIDTPRMLVVAIGTLGAFAAIANLILAWKILRTKAVTMGGWLAHVGIGVIFLGTVLANVYEKTDFTWLMENGPAQKTPFGYKVQYAGWSHDDLERSIEQETDPAVRDRLVRKLNQDWLSFGHGLRLKLIPDNSNVARAEDSHSSDEPGSFVVQTSIFNNHQAMFNGDMDSAKTMRWPHIHKELLRDVYILVPADPKRTRPSAELVPGQSARVMYRYDDSNIAATDYVVAYNKFAMQGAPGQPGTKMVADLQLMTPDGKTYPFRAAMELSPDGLRGIPVQIPQASAAAILTGGIDARTKGIHVEFEFPDAGTRWLVPLSVTNKPYINLVWLGVILMGIGTIIAMIRRSLEARKGTLLAVAASAGAVDVAVPASDLAVEPNGNGTKAAGTGTRKVKAKAKSSR